MFKKIFGLLLLVTFVVPSVSFAKGECKEDREKYCGNVRPRKVKQCMKEHASQLSQPCKMKMAEKAEEKMEKKMENQGK